MPKSNAWIKFEKSLIHDPRVGLIAEKLMDHTPALRNAVTPVTVVTLVLGGLMRMWAYSDTYIRYDDDVIETTPALVNQFVGIENFVQFLPQDWFEVVDATHVKFPEFHRHNASRSKNAARQARFRERARSKKDTVDVTGSVTPALRNAVTPVTHNALDRDRDRDRDRDLLSLTDLSTHHPVDTQLLDTPRRATAKRLAEDFGLTPERRSIAEAEHVDCEREMAKFKDYWLAASGANARKHDWDAAWRNWCRKAAEQPRLNGRGTSVEKVVHFGPPRDLWGETAK